MTLTLSFKGRDRIARRHMCTSQQLSTFVNRHAEENGWRLLIDHYLSLAGNDGAILTKAVSQFGTVGPYSSRQLQG
jgi:hypothetical protein